LEYHEEAVAQVDPDPAGPYPSGLHTLSKVGNITLIDGKRTRFIPAIIRRVLSKKLNEVLKRSNAPAAH
jgi:hypothetical protein